MKKSTICLSIIICSALLPSHIFAEEQSVKKKEVLDSITVSEKVERSDLAPDSPKNFARTTESSSNHIQVITSEEIADLRPRDVFELLNSATGIIATQSSKKGFTGLSVRGDSNFRWIVDGAIIQPNMASRMLKSLPVMAIEQVKIVRGGSALTLGPLVGSASPGGAPVDGFIVINTKKPSKDEGQLRLAAESFDTNQASIWAGKQLNPENGKAYISGVLSSSDTNGSNDTLDNGMSYNTFKTSKSGIAKTGFEKSGWIVDLLAYNEDGEFGIPNTNSHGSGSSNWYMDPAKSYLYSATGSKEWNDMNTTLFGLSRAKSEQSFYTTPTTFNQNDNIQNHAYLRHIIDFNSSTKLTAGADYLHWDAPNGQQYYEGIHREEETKGLFSQVEHKLTDKMTIDVSYRRDQVHVDHGLDYYTGGKQPVGGVNSPLIYEDRTLAPAEFVSIGSSYKLLDNLELTARYSQGKQDAQSGITPAPSVVFEDDEQKKYEIGLEAKLYDLFNPSINLFQRDVINEKDVVAYTYTTVSGATKTTTTTIIPTTGANNVKWNSNTTPTPLYGQSDTKRSGVELSSTGYFAQRSSYRTSLTHFYDMSESAENTTPTNIADFSVSHGIDKFTLTSAVKHVSTYNTYSGGYTSLNAGVGYDFKLGKNDTRITTYGRNLTDKHYETSAGVEDQGRVLGVELTYAF